MAIKKYEPWNVNNALTVKPTQQYQGGQVQTGDYMNSGYESNDGGLFSDLSGQDMFDGALGVGQLGLGLFNFLENRKFNDARIKGLNEQIASSQYARGAHKNFVSGSRQAFA